MNAPILVLGAHRSGTSVLNRALAELGVFTGHSRDPNDEAWFFLRLNEWLLAQCGGRWDHPEPIRDLLADATLRRLAVEYLELSLDSPRCRNFLGLRGWLHHRSVRRLEIPWGFKDPRTTFTLPLWLDVFPNAKVVHIERHGVDVAASLRSRSRKNLERSKKLFSRNRPLLRWMDKRAGFTDSTRCMSLAGAYAVWETYLREARTHVARLGEQACTLSYEDLVADPRTQLERVAEFCGLAPSFVQFVTACDLLHGGRASAHREDPELRAFAESVTAPDAAPEPSPTPEGVR